MQRPSSLVAQSCLDQARAAQREAARMPRRPYGALLVGMSVLQAMLLVTISIAMHGSSWRWSAALVLLASGIALSFLGGWVASALRVALPEGFGKLDRFRRVWNKRMALGTAAVSGALAPNLLESHVGSGSPVVFLVGGLGIVSILPQLYMGVRLWMK